KIENLISKFETSGTADVSAVCDEGASSCSAAQWNNFSKQEQEKILLQYRLTYLAETEVNWCSALGTVLDNDEIVNGGSEGGGRPVVRKRMMAWSMRISAYADRLLQDLENIDWPEALKEIQRNWIGRSVGAQVRFNILSEQTPSNDFIEVFTTRPDTIFGVSFMTLAPEHPLVEKITTASQKQDRK